MARTSTSRRRERDSDPMDSLKPLIVLGLLGTIMYGAYTVVQKGPGAPPPGVVGADGGTATGVFAAPEVSLPPLPTAAPAASTHPLAGAEPLQAAPPSDPGLVPTPPVAPPPFAAPGAVATLAPAPSTAPPPAALPPAAEPFAEPSPLPPAEALLTPVAAAASPALPPAMNVAPPERPAPSAAFTAAWTDAHDKLRAGRYAEALSLLSVWYDDPALSPEESQRLEDLLGQLAGTVIWSQKDLLLPAHIVGQGDTLQSIAAPLQVQWQVLAKINGIGDPIQLVQGEQLKLVRGPFDAVISLSRRRMSLQVGGNYAGSFPVVIGRQVHDRVGQSVAVIDINRPGTTAEPAAIAAQVAYAPGVGRKSVILGEGLAIEGVEDLSLVADASSPSSVFVSLRDLEDIADILGPGSQVLVRR